MKGLILATLASIGLSWTSRASAVSAQGNSSRRQFDSIVVDVNGERRKVSQADGLTVVRGDLVTFVEAITIPSSETKYSIDLSGFGDVSPDGGNDTGKVIDTAVDVHGGKLLKGGDRRFNIKVSGRGTNKAEFFMTMVEPRLLALDINVNGQRLRITDKDRLKLSRSDEIQVLDVRTNIRGNENVTHDLMAKDWANIRRLKEVRFFRGTSIFARIPIDWKGS